MCGKRRKVLLLGDVFGIQERLHWRFAVAIFSRVRTVIVVELQPLVKIGLKLVERGVKLLSERRIIKLVTPQVGQAVRSFAISASGLS